MMRRILFALALLLLAPSAALAAGQLVISARFNSGGNEFDFGQYTENGGKDKVAIIGIEIRNQRTSVAFDPAEWHSFAALWQQAQSVRSATWQAVGTYKETGTTEAALLTISAGPGVQFTITGNKGPFTFVLLPGDYVRFDAAVKQMASWASP